jgi:hypothetical protein
MAKTYLDDSIASKSFKRKTLETLQSLIEYVKTLVYIATLTLCLSIAKAILLL